jgi:hypothetical protein
MQQGSWRGDRGRRSCTPLLHRRAWSWATTPILHANSPIPPPLPSSPFPPAPHLEGQDLLCRGVPAHRLAVDDDGGGAGRQPGLDCRHDVGVAGRGVLRVAAVDGDGGAAVQDMDLGGSEGERVGGGVGVGGWVGGGGGKVWGMAVVAAVEGCQDQGVCKGERQQ